MSRPQVKGRAALALSGQSMVRAVTLTSASSKTLIVSSPLPELLPLTGSFTWNWSMATLPEPTNLWKLRWLQVTLQDLLTVVEPREMLLEDWFPTGLKVQSLVGLPPPGSPWAMLTVTSALTGVVGPLFWTSTSTWQLKGMLMSAGSSQVTVTAVTARSALSKTA